jgi:hypothetical protein
MTLEAYDPDRLDLLALRLLDVCGRVRVLAGRCRDEELSSVTLHDRKALEWIDKLEDWLARSAPGSQNRHNPRGRFFSAVVFHAPRRVVALRQSLRAVSPVSTFAGHGIIAAAGYRARSARVEDLTRLALVRSRLLVEARHAPGNHQPGHWTGVSGCVGLGRHDARATDLASFALQRPSGDAR